MTARTQDQGLPGEQTPRGILLVDDDRTFCAALAGALRRRGHTVHVAHSYDEATTEALASRPDRAVVDLRMPGRGGLELVQALRGILPELRIVVLTGYGNVATAAQAIRAGAAGLLAKPADANEILAALGPGGTGVDASPRAADRENRGD